MIPTMPKTVNSGQLLTKKIRVIPAQWRAVAERSKAEGVSASTVVRDALNLLLGLDGRAVDRVNRPMAQLPTLPKGGFAYPRPDPARAAAALSILDGTPQLDPEDSPDSYEEEYDAASAPHDQTPPTSPSAHTRPLKLPRKKKAKTKSKKDYGSEDIYVIKADPEGGLHQDLHIPYRKVLKFWKLLPNESEGVAAPTDALVRKLAPQCGLGTLEAYELFGCLEWDADIRERLERDAPST